MIRACIVVLLATSLTAAESGIEKIAAYAGTWTIATEHLATPFSKAGKESKTLKNECWRSGAYYACNQFVDGESKVLIVFTYTSKEDAYTSYVIPKDGTPANSGKLIIRGNTWTFPWEDQQGGKTTYFQVVNVFTAPDTIEFRQEYSADKTHWKIMAKGLEKKH